MTESSLYERLGGVFAIAAVVDHFSDALINNPMVGKGSHNPDLHEWSTRNLDEAARTEVHAHALGVRRGRGARQVRRDPSRATPSLGSRRLTAIYRSRPRSSTKSPPNSRAPLTPSTCRGREGRGARRVRGAQGRGDRGYKMAAGSRLTLVTAGSPVISPGRLRGGGSAARVIAPSGPVSTSPSARFVLRRAGQPGKEDVGE